MERGTNAGYCTSSTYFFVLYIFSFVFSLSCPWILLLLSSLLATWKLGSQKHRTAGWSMHLPYFTLVRSFWAASFAPSLRVAWLIFDFLPASLKVGWDIQVGLARILSHPSLHVSVVFITVSALMLVFLFRPLVSHSSLSTSGKTTTIQHPPFQLLSQVVRTLPPPDSIDSTRSHDILDCAI